VLALPYRQMVQSVGTNALLTCLVHAFPSSDLRWTRSGRSDGPITDTTGNEKYRLHNWTLDEYSILYGLHISSIAWSDYGTYYCIASNEFGTDRAQLVVEGIFFIVFHSVIGLLRSISVGSFLVFIKKSFLYVLGFFLGL